MPFRPFSKLHAGWLVLPVSLSGLVLLSGCGVPNRPQVAAPQTVQSAEWGQATAAVEDGQGAQAPAGDDFWHRFGSPQLAGLVADGLRGNASLDAARARVLAARAQLRTARAALLPTVSGNLGLARTQTDVINASPFANSEGSASLDIAYDVDLFGGARATRRAGAARVDAARFDAAAAALVIETDLARGFVQLAAADARLAVADTILADAREMRRLVALRLREGSVSPLDLDRQTLEVRRLEAERTQTEQTRRALVAALAVLAGREAPGFTLRPDPLDMLAVPALDAGQPASLALRRPDLRAVEAGIAAANGDITAARAAFLPGLRLSANGLGQALSASGPFGWTATLGSSLFAPVFQGGRLRARFEQASAQQTESLALYRQALLQALQEGVNALAAVDLAGQREAILRQSLDLAGRATRLSSAQFKQGEIDLTGVLDARRNEMALRLAAIDARQDRLLAAIDLYKALGGTPAK